MLALDSSRDKSSFDREAPTLLCVSQQALLDDIVNEAPPARNKMTAPARASTCARRRRGDKEWGHTSLDNPDAAVNR